MAGDEERRNWAKLRRMKPPARFLGKLLLSGAGRQENWTRMEDLGNHNAKDTVVNVGQDLPSLSSDDDLVVVIALYYIPSVPLGLA